MITNCKRVSSDNITTLRPNEIFVFGSNQKGLHKEGAAKYASDHFGAQWGVGNGRTGQCYAIPTMEGKMHIRYTVKMFIDYAKKHPEKTFLVTKIGCGIAGYEVSDIAPMFKPALKLTNVYLPLEFFDYYV